jgi:hypothetical protein
MRILPGLNVTFSLKRALGITRMKRVISAKSGVPLTLAGLHRKLGRLLLRLVGLR